MAHDIHEVDATVDEHSASRLSGLATPSSIHVRSLPVGKGALYADHSAHGTLAHQFCCPCDVGGEAQVFAVHEQDIVRLCGGYHTITVGQRHGKRLFAEDVFACLCCLDDHAGMQIVRQAEIDRVHVRTRQNFCVGFVRGGLWLRL